MEPKVYSGEKHLIDLENGLNECAFEENVDADICSNRKARKISHEVWNASEDAFASAVDENAVTLNSRQGSAAFLDGSLANREASPGDPEKQKAENPSKKGSKKPPKPPRPPKSLVLSIADEKLVRELAKLSMLKKERDARIKALKRKRTANASSSSCSNICAMLITAIFCLVIFWQAL